MRTLLIFIDEPFGRDRYDTNICFELCASFVGATWPASHTLYTEEAMTRFKEPFD